MLGWRIILAKDVLLMLGGGGGTLALRSSAIS